MEKLFVPYEIAKQLKEKGFKESCFSGYDNLGQLNIRRVDFQSDIIGFCLAPLYQQVIDWFFEKHNIQIVENFIERPICESGEEIRFSCAVWKADTVGYIETKRNQKRIFPHSHSRYEALNLAIEEALKLI